MTPADVARLWLGGGIAITALLGGAVLFWLVAEMRARRARPSPSPPETPPPQTPTGPDRPAA